MKRKILALALALTLCLGLVPTAGLAYTTADFSDVPSTHWAYGAVMRMADKGVLNGVGEGKFNPDGKVTAEQFITLVGRAVFPDVKVEGKDWSGPYISEAKAKGMLEGTNVTDEAIKSEITRYDMAVILAKAVEILKVSATKADASKVNDYGEVPTKYVDAVLTAYGSGLITGDDNHNFNGGNTMRRSEAATVMDRLITKKSEGTGTSQKSESTTTGEKTEESSTKKSYGSYMAFCAPRADYDPSTVVIKEGDSLWIDSSYVADEAKGTYLEGDLYLHVGDTFQFAISQVPAGYGYADGDLNEQVQYKLEHMNQRTNSSLIERLSKGIWSSSNEKVATVDENGFVTIIGPGETAIGVELPVLYYNERWVTTSSTVVIRVDP